MASSDLVLGVDLGEELLEQADLDLIGFLALGHKERIAELDRDLQPCLRELGHLLIEKALLLFLRVLDEDDLKDLIDLGRELFLLSLGLLRFPGRVPQLGPRVGNEGVRRLKLDRHLADLVEFVDLGHDLDRLDAGLNDAGTGGAGGWTTEADAKLL